MNGARADKSGARFAACDDCRGVSERPGGCLTAYGCFSIGAFFYNYIQMRTAPAPEAPYPVAYPMPNARIPAFRTMTIAHFDWISCCSLRLCCSVVSIMH